MRVLVTGGSGFIGRHVVRALRARGDEVSVVDFDPFPDPGVPCVAGDLREAAVVDAAVAAGLDGIVHLAALTSVLESVHRPRETYETNVAVTAALLERARDLGIARFVMASTNAVVGLGVPVIDESAPCNPLTPYGATKAAAEMLVSAYAGCYEMAAASLRLTNVYGPGMHGKDSVVPRLMRAAASGGIARVYGSGEQVRDYLYVGDAAAAFCLALDRGITGPLTIGTERSVSVNALVALVREVTGVHLGTERVAAPKGEMPGVVVRTARARSLGFAAATELPEGLRRTWRADYAASLTVG